MKRNCNICGEEFDTQSPEKRAVGGLITTCPDCSEEHTVKYAGVQSADGKQAQATILKFNNEADKKAYIRFWKNNTGWNKGKSCQLGNHLSTTPGISFESVQTFHATNHKGKA
jgi:ribosome-binding protein aMBF1 (putative translation factor)